MGENPRPQGALKLKGYHNEYRIRIKMEELITLKQLLHEGKVTEALELVEELEEMSKSDKVNKIYSYGIILLLHLIKQSAEKRTTRSWDVSIWNAIKQIQRTNQRYKAKGTYLTEEELAETLEDAYELALKVTVHGG